MPKRRTFTAEFESQLALKVISGEQSAAELCRQPLGEQVGRKPGLCNYPAEADLLHGKSVRSVVSHSQAA